MTIKEEDFHIYECNHDNGEETLKKIRWITGTGYRVDLANADREFHFHIQFKDWCLENCTNKVVFYNFDSYGNIKIVVFFYSKEDAVLAKLTWEDNQ